MNELEMRMMFMNPLSCDLEKLGSIVRLLESPNSYTSEGVMLFTTNITHYKNAEKALRNINEITGKRYATLREYFLSTAPNEDIKHELETLISEDGN